MKQFVGFAGLLLVSASSTFADCGDYLCAKVEIESIQSGSAGPLVKTSGDESLLKCDDFYGQLAIRVSDDYREKESLLVAANEYDLTVDIHLYKDISPCAIERIIVYSTQ